MLASPSLQSVPLLLLHHFLKGNFLTPLFQHVTIKIHITSITNQGQEEHIKEDSVIDKEAAGCEEVEGLPVISIDKLPTNWKELGFDEWLNLFKDWKGERVEHTFTNLLYRS